MELVKFTFRLTGLNFENYLHELSNDAVNAEENMRFWIGRFINYEL